LRCPQNAQKGFEIGEDLIISSLEVKNMLAKQIRSVVDPCLQKVVRILGAPPLKFSAQWTFRWHGGES
jgi:hypothetical protein